MASVFGILEQLEATNSRIDKDEILELNARNALLQRTFRLALDPFINFGVKKVDPRRAVATTVESDADGVLTNFLDILELELATGRSTGLGARELVERAMWSMDDVQLKWCRRILLRNMRCGVSTVSANRIWSNLIPEFRIMLAERLNVVETTGGMTLDDGALAYPAQVEPKLDGLRCISIKRSGNVSLYARSGSAIDTVPTISRWLQVHQPADTVFDGELVSTTNEFVAAASIVSSRRRKKSDAEMLYKVFDLITVAEFDGKLPGAPLRERAENLRRALEHLQGPVSIVPHVLVNDAAGVLEQYSRALESGYEGIMVKDPASPYMFERSRAVMKLKPTRDAEGIVVGWYSAGLGTKREGLFGGFEVMLSNGITTRVGGGYSDKLKADVQLDGPENYVGRIITFEFQPDPASSDGLSPDGRARFPVFVRFRPPIDLDPKLVSIGEERIGPLGAQGFQARCGGIDR